MSQYSSAIEHAVELMAVAAITAPKGRGQDYVRTMVLTDEEMKKLGEAMIAYGERTGKRNFDRDGQNVIDSDAVLLIGLDDAPGAGVDCGACGYATCKEFNEAQKVTVEYTGPNCPVRVLDMGIALGSAAKMASTFNLDNRVVYRVGPVAREMGLVDWPFVMGIPVSVSSKSIYFDRK